jgi:hypothetical protein
MKLDIRNRLSPETIHPFIFHITFISIAISLLFFRFLPLLLNPNLDYGGDEVFHAREIWELLQGRDLFFYYENVNYHGNLEGLAAIPFVKLFGFHPLPFKLPATIFYGLFIWSTFLLLRTFNPIAAWIASVFLIFPPQWVVGWAILNNYVFSPILFFGNLTLYYFVKSKTNDCLNKKTIFFLCFFSGLAIYVWTYSIIYIFTIIFLLALTHPNWDQLRGRISVKRLCSSFKFLKTKKNKLARVYDAVIYFFLSAIVYSYIFGGFGLDIGGITILQINNLHKPVLQLIPLIIIRLLLIKTGFLPSIANPIKHLQSFDKNFKAIALVGALGFILGILPRIISILNGSVTRGGQGFDVDFSPSRIFTHALKLLELLPSVMGLEVKNITSFSLNNDLTFSQIQTIFLIPTAGLISYSIYFFFNSNWKPIKTLAKLKRVPFNPNLILIVLPAALSASVIISMNGPYDHYLIPIYWVISIYVALFISNTIIHSKGLGVSFIAIWIIFHSMTFEYSLDELFKLKESISSNNHQSLKSFLTRSKKPFINLSNFLNSKDITAVYSTSVSSSRIILLTEGKIAAAGFVRSSRSKRLRKNLENYSNFALVFSETEPTYSEVMKFLKENQITFKQQLVSLSPHPSQIVIYNFTGDPEMINKLRSLSR